jgi:hypothetical protein
MLTFKADGYVLQSKAITPDKDQALSVALKKKPGSGSHSTKNDILDPFKKGK